MKKLYYILSAFLILSSSLQAQQENRFDKKFSEADKAFDSIINSEEAKNKYAKAAREAAEETNRELAEEIQEITRVPAEVIARLSPNAEPGSHIITNHPALPGLLKEFYGSAKYYKVDYAKELLTLNKVILIRADLNFLGGVVEFDGHREIWINSILPVQYPNLFWIIFHRQMGKLYGLEDDTSTYRLEFMSSRWELNPKFENFAWNKKQNHAIKKSFYEQLARKHPLDKKI